MSLREDNLMTVTTASLKMGTDLAPDEGLARPQTLSTGTAIVGTVEPVRRDNLATYIAKHSTDDAPLPVPIVERLSTADRASGTFRESWTTGRGRNMVTHYRVVRTLDMGDEPLPAPRYRTDRY